MASFSYQHLPFFVDHVLNSDPDMMMKMSSSSSPTTFPSPSSCFFLENQSQHQNCNSKSNYSKPTSYGEQFRFHCPVGNLVNFHQEQHNPIDCGVHESRCVEQGTAMAFVHSPPASSNNEPSVTAKQTIQSGGGGGGGSGGEQRTQNWALLHNKRKPTGDGSSPYSVNSKDVTSGRRKKQKKCNKALKKEEKDQDGKGIKEQNNALPAQEDPKGYIHVRARRGQATDSHSLAERVRREKIGERMRLLQALVPGCDKVTGRAAMLEEIINYVQSLQSQVEFLSVKLASLNPMIYNYGVDLEAVLLEQQDLSNMIPALPSVQQCSPSTTSPTANTQPTAVATSTATTVGFHRTVDCPLVDAPAIFQQQEEQLEQRGADPPCLVQDNVGSLYLEVVDQGGLDLINQSGFCNNYSVYSFKEK